MTKRENAVRFKAVEGEGAAPETVSARVLPQGADRIFTGEADNGAQAEARFPTYPRGAVFLVERSVAEALEARGLVEIQP